MVFFNYSTMQMVIKVVYYGPGLCGKTTNLEFIYSKTAPNSRGEMVSLETETDRTLFFDLLPIDVGVIGGFKTRFQLYTVPGQVFYNSTRQLVLKGVDGIIFVADSQKPMLDANLDSFENMKENLKLAELEYNSMPIIMQYNKRDLQNVLPVEELNRELNKDGFPFVEACAIDGTGVFETLKLASKHTLMSVKKKMVEQNAKPKPTPTPVATAAAPAPAPVSQPDNESAPAPDPVEPAPEPKETTAPVMEEPALGKPEIQEMTKATPVTEMAPEPEPEEDAPQLTMDDIPETPAADTPRKLKKRPKRDMDVDELLSGLVPSKQTFIKKLKYDFDRTAFQKFQEASMILELKDEDGNVVETRSFTTQLSKKSGTKKMLLKLNIDLES